MDAQYAKEATRYAGGLTSSGMSVPNKPSGPTVIGEATDGVADATKRVYQLASVLREFNDQTLGEQPETSGSDRASAPSSRGDQLRANVGSLHAALTELEHQAERLRNI